VRFDTTCLNSQNKNGLLFDVESLGEILLTAAGLVAIAATLLPLIRCQAWWIRIRSAVDSASDGDVIRLGAGTYNESFSVLNKQNLTIIGVGAVTINSQPDHPSPTGAQKGINIVNSVNVRIENVVIDGSATPVTDPGWATGIDATGAPGLTLTNVTIKNFGKNGIAITAKSTASAAESGSPTPLVTENVTFNTVTVDNAGWAGIAFYGVDFTDGNAQHNIQGVSFVGTTTISGTQYGVQFGDHDDEVIVSGPSGAPVNLGVVVFENNDANISNDLANTPIILSANSTINGRPVSADDFPGLLITVQAAGEGSLVPGVPNTGLL
jgi:hypothetical protein